MTTTATHSLFTTEELATKDAWTLGMILETQESTLKDPARLHCGMTREQTVAAAYDTRWAVLTEQSRRPR
jgi:hypothetical protein